MAQPTINQSHPINRILTNVSLAYMQNATNFVATQAFPSVPVDRATNAYFTYTKNDWFRDEAQVRGPAQESAGSGYNLSTDTYRCDVFAFHKDVDNQTLNSSDMPLNPNRDATEFVTSRLLLRREIQWATDYFATSVWGTDSTPTNLWSNYATSDPITDVETGKRTVLINTGFLPNTLILGYDVWIQLKNHPDIIDRGGKYTATAGNPAVVNRQVLAALFDVERVLVAMGVKATNLESETAVMAFTHGKHALLCYAAPAPSLLQPSAGYCFEWTGVSQGDGQTIGVKDIPMPLNDARRIEGQIAFDNKVVATDMGYFFNSAVS
jgi:hypothetical protein